MLEEDNYLVVMVDVFLIWKNFHDSRTLQRPLDGCTSQVALLKAMSNSVFDSLLVWYFTVIVTVIFRVLVRMQVRN